ncbi:MAG: hypothetical protein JW904_05560 [Spirochaetales bacterium]|nr:hypothetical protein [Spirochaetales bacterium]
MIIINFLADTDAQFAMDNGEFDSTVIHSNGNAAVILSQNWCSQWKYLEKDLENLKKTQDIELAVYIFLYNRSPLFQSFMNFKETVFKNKQIPYIRCYKNGRLIRESNFVPGKNLIDFFKE